MFGNESSVLTVSAMLRGEYGQKDVFVGVPCIVNRSGIQRVLELNLSEEEAGTVQRFLRDAAGELCRTEAINRRKEKEADGSVPSASFLARKGQSAASSGARSPKTSHSTCAVVLGLAQRSGNGPLRPYDTMSACCRAVTNEHPVKK